MHGSSPPRGLHGPALHGGFTLVCSENSETCNRDGTPCVRSVQEQAFTVTASHPLTWCQQGGKTIRCLTPEECALLQGFPADWRLPAGSRLGIRAAGNAIPPPMAAAIVRCALRAAGLHAPSPPPIPTPLPALPPAPLPALPPPAVSEGAEETGYVPHAKYRGLKRRVDMLEVIVIKMRPS